MNKWMILLLSCVLIAGCTISINGNSNTSSGYSNVDDIENGNNDIQNVENVVISGSSNYREINTNSSINLVISGTGNTIRVLSGNVISITISGSDNTIYLPYNVNPQIIDSGINDRVLHE